MTDTMTRPRATTIRLPVHLERYVAEVDDWHREAVRVQRRRRRARQALVRAATR